MPLWHLTVLRAPNPSLTFLRVESGTGFLSPGLAAALGWTKSFQGSVTNAEQLAKHGRCSIRQINLTLSLSFLAPQLVKAAVEGRLPRGINMERLRDLDTDWSRQFQELGFDPGSRALSRSPRCSQTLAVDR
jgi:hypothetical protein